MQPQISASAKEIIQKVTEELGKACADKFGRLESDRKVFDETVRSVSKLCEIISPSAGVPCCFGHTDGTAPDDQTCINWGGKPGKCGKGGGPLPLEKRQTLIHKITEGLAQKFADKIDKAGSESKKLYEAVLQRLAPLFKDANDGLAGALVSCRLPDGTSLPGLTKEQCHNVGGTVKG